MNIFNDDHLSRHERVQREQTRQRLAIMPPHIVAELVANHYLKLASNAKSQLEILRYSQHPNGEAAQATLTLLMDDINTEFAKDFGCDAPWVIQNEAPCRHEWFQGRCVHCERTPSEVRRS